ncbi:hypothetical protein SDC9_115905 [bioreactor metagenome]|uniref:DUF6291 domain-containing protein n=1 Tax=bioreactor metagenome TaxID=1076179 RepID=A0A645BV54_9ZZZZ
MAKKSFSIHSDYYEELSNLTDEQRGKLLNAFIKWASDAEKVELDVMCAMLFRLMIAQIERISQANSANGSKGGRPSKTEKSEETEKSREKPIKPTVTNTITISDTNTNTIVGADALATITDMEEIQIKNKQIKQGKYSNVSLSADEYSKLLSEFGESTVNHYLTIVDEWAKTLPQGNKIKNSDKVIRKAIAEKWGCNGTVKNSNTNVTRTEADYNAPFIRRYENE